MRACPLTPLPVAQGHEAAARLLVSELGASLEVADGDGDRPLAWAAYKGQLATVRPPYALAPCVAVFT